MLFNLSSWSEKRLPIRQWLIDELREKYQVPKVLAQSWVEHDELLPLLDGLDEVKREYREDCIKALNDFQQSCKAFVPLALCSRTAEYEVLTSKLKFNGAIILRSLTAQQIDSFLTYAGDKLSVVAHLLRHDTELQTLAQSPLMFSILCFTYKDKVITNVQQMDETKPRLQRLFNDYIMQMFQHRGQLTFNRYPRGQVLSWLKWLATRLVQSKQTFFLIEQMQPSWLGDDLQQPSRLSSITLFTLPLYSLICGLTYGLLWQLSSNSIPVSDGTAFSNVEVAAAWLRGEESSRLYAGLGIGLVGGTFGVLVDRLSDRFRNINSFEPSSVLRRRLRNSVYTTLFWWISGWLSLTLISILIMLSSHNYEVINSKILDLIQVSLSFFLLTRNWYAGLYLGLIGGLSSLFREIEPANYLKYRSWQNIQSSLFYFLTIGLIGGAIVVLINKLVGGPIDELSGMLSALITGLISSLIFQVSIDSNIKIDVETKTPNQGIWLATKYSLITGFVFGLLGLLFDVVYEILIEPFIMIIVLTSTLTKELTLTFLIEAFNSVLNPEILKAIIISFDLRTMVVFAMLGGLGGGGNIIIKHFILRFCLWWRGYIPWNYARFLDYCADRIFLRKAGGGYIFIHRLLMEHFASLTEEDIKRLSGSR